MKTKTLPVYRQTVNGKVITVKNVKVTVFDDGEEGFSAHECRRFERAVEKVFTKKGKHRKDCISCRRYGKIGERR